MVPCVYFGVFRANHFFTDIDAAPLDYLLSLYNNLLNIYAAFHYCTIKV